MLIFNAFLLGLSTGIFCLSYCGPIYLPQLIAQKDKYRGWGVFLQFNAGRLFAYIIFGAVFGWLGTNIHIQFLNIFTKWIIIILALLLIAYGLGLSLPKIKWCAWTKNIHFPILSGFLLGINICPPFLLALIHNFQIGGVINGVLFFIMFFSGTTVYFIPITFLGYFTKIQWLRQAGRIAAIIIGIIFIIQSL
jgi:sulfite exporter TauE/SafE